MIAVTLYSPWGGLPAPDIRPEKVPFLPPLPANDDQCARTCANWDDGRCEVCGASYDGFRVDGSYRCPAWRSRTA